MSDTKKENKDRLTPMPWLIGLAVVLALALFVYVYAVISDSSSSGVIKLTEKTEGVLIDEKNGITYYELSGEYEARFRVSNAHYGKAGKKKLYQLAYKEKEAINKVNGYLWLAETPEDGGSVYASSAAHVPSLENFDWENVIVCTDVKDELVVALHSLSGASADLFVNGYLEKNPYDGGGLPFETYKVRITSKSYGWLYYTLYLVRCDNGDYYVYSESDRKSYAVESSLFLSSLGGAVK